MASEAVGKLLLLALVLAAACCGCAQRRDFTFRVVDAETRAPLPGVSVTQLRTGRMLQPGAGPPILVFVSWPYPVEEQKTDKQGLVQFHDVPANHYFWLDLDGYQDSDVHDLGPAINVGRRGCSDRQELHLAIDESDLQGVINVPLSRESEGPAATISLKYSNAAASPDSPSGYAQPAQQGKSAQPEHNTAPPRVVSK